MWWTSGTGRKIVNPFRQKSTFINASSTVPTDEERAVRWKRSLRACACRSTSKPALCHSATSLCSSMGTDWWFVEVGLSCWDSPSNSPPTSQSSPFPKLSPTGTEHCLFSFALKPPLRCFSAYLQSQGLHFLSLLFPFLFYWETVRKNMMEKEFRVFLGQSMV